jgi:phage gpG-like protein
VSTYHIDLEVFGDERTRAHLRAIIERGLHWQPAFAELERLYEGLELEWFGSHGRGSWPPLAASTAAAKRSHGLSASTLVGSGRLRASLTRTTSDSMRRMSNDRFAFGTTLPYARFHRYGTKKMPARSPLHPVDRRMITETAAVLRAYLVGKLPGVR